MSGQVGPDHPLDLTATHGAAGQAGGAAGAAQQVTAGDEHDLRRRMEE